MNKIYSYFKVVSLLFIFGFFTSFLASAQNKITGTVTDETQLALPGVSILIKGTNTGTTTQNNGSYSLVAQPGQTLIFSFLGSVTQEILVSSQNTIDVVLATDAKSLSEVVVTALGIKKERKLVSYATQEVSGAELIKAREPNPMNSLVGKVAGLSVGSSAEMLGRPEVLLRGSSINLYVVDGIPINSDTWNISPDDIENITILKGAAASALYGYRGQRGAIIISTKKGSSDKRGFSIDYNSSTMIDKGFIALPITQDLYGPGDHGRYSFVDGKGGGLNDGDYDIWGPKFEGQLIPQYDSPVNSAGLRQGTPWLARGKDNLSRFIQAGLLSTNNIAVSSSGEKYDLRASVSHSYQKGIVPNTSLNITNFNINTGYKFSNKLKLDAQLNYNRQYTPNIPDVNYGPNSMIYNITIWGGADWNIDDMRNYWQPGKEGVQSNYAEYQRYHNPYFLVNEWTRGHYKTDMYGYASLTRKFGNKVELMGRSSLTNYDLLRNEKMPFSAHPYGREEGKGDYREDNRSLFENNNELILHYNNKLGFLGISTFAGGSLRNFSYKSNFVTTDYLNVPGVYTFANSRNPVKAYSFNGDMRVLSAFYSADIALSRYFNLGATGRVDKISTLSKSYFYPSVSGNSIISDYVTLPSLVSLLKLRASYANVKSAGSSVATTIGATPNANYPIGYGAAYQGSYDGPTYSLESPYNTGLGYNNQPYASFSNNLVDPSISPDSRSSLEFGLDTRFVKDRIGFDVAYFINTDGPQIYNQPISESTGYTSFITNAVKTQTKGAEISLTGLIIQNKNFNWSTLLNYSSYRTTLQELPQGTDVLFNFYRKGDRLDKLYVSSFVKNAEGQIVNDAGGRPLVNPVAQFQGYTSPDWVWGFNNKFSYKAINLSFQFDGRVGGTMENYVRRQTFRGGRHLETVEGAMGDARYQDYLGVKSYTGEGVVISNGVAPTYDAATGAITNYSALQFSPNGTKTFLQDYISRYNSTTEGNLMSKSYLKLREVTVGFNVPKSLFGNTSLFKSATVSVVGRNLLYFIKDNRFKDVDIDQYAGSQSSSNLQTPTTRRYGFNLNIVF
ncbi:MAG: SusC/RagA family TonB-linked outer membrane protein [Flavobacterium sp.]|nr:SusC/RagA family TonB-linked outer membrane protein [Pedobacter sp.]